MYHLGCQWPHFHEILYRGACIKVCRQSQHFVKDGKNYWALYVKTYICTVFQKYRNVMRTLPTLFRNFVSFAWNAHGKKNRWMLTKLWQKEASYWADINTDGPKWQHGSRNGNGTVLYLRYAKFESRLNKRETWFLWFLSYTTGKFLNHISIRLGPPPSKYLPVHHSPVTLNVGALWSGILTMP